jgi:hypothetical protein
MIERTHGSGRKQNNFCLVCRGVVNYSDRKTTILIENSELGFIGYLCSLACMFKYNKNPGKYREDGKKNMQSNV